ncbi:hypothetical protein JCM10295v2_001208 [Rhodotorula toruloides]
MHISDSPIFEVVLQPTYLPKGGGAKVEGIFDDGGRGYSGTNISVDATLTTSASWDPYVQFAEERHAAAELVNRSMSEQVPNDVALPFPRSQQLIWSSESSLVASSSLFETLLRSNFKEASPSTKLDDVFTPDSSASAELPFDDSDDETNKAWLIKRVEPRGNALAPFKLVKVTDSCFVTYAAVLAWIFADETNTTQIDARSARLTDLVKEHSNLPVPASPKSLFRLAHYLDLEQLATLALKNLGSQLTPQNDAHELSSRIACCYPRLKDADDGKLPAEFGKTALLLAKALKPKN